MKHQKFGIAIGPTNPGDTSIFQEVISSIDDVDEKDCTVHTFPDYNFISVEVPSYGIQKDFASYKENSQIHISMVDIANFETLAERIWEDFPNIIRGTAVNFSRAQHKYHFTPKYPPNISTLVFLTSMYAIKNGLLIDSFNFSNCNINKLNGFSDFLTYFPKIQEVNLSGNPNLDLKDIQLFFGGAKIITDNPVDDFEGQKNPEIEQQDLDDVDVNTVNFEEHPELVFRSLRAEKQLTLDMFPPIVIDIDSSPINPFLIDYFRSFSEPITENKKNYYSNDAVFSISTSKSSCTQLYTELESNLQDTKVNHVIGNENIIVALSNIFPNGFVANINCLNGSLISESMFSVILHGVFISINGSILGFDRSFVICYRDYNFVITNDNIFIRNPPKSL